MNIVFIENRYKTFFYEQISLGLLKNGYTIHWIVQNHDFKPKLHKENVHVIPYPPRKFHFKDNELIENEIIKIDRQQNFFNKKTKDYFYYYEKKIVAILDFIKPNVIFGESTVFHELLAIEYCKKNDILFLAPSSCRYPIGRFSFYINDTLKPYRGSNEVLDNSKALEIINAIIKRKISPGYMTAILPTKKEEIYDRIIKLKSYFKGEKYNTPSPKSKFKAGQRLKKLKEKWDCNASMNISNSKTFNVLYPLHLQPESSIDVFGKKYLDQTALIKQIASFLPENGVLYLKPNPKSYLELTQELLDFTERSKNVVHIHHSVKMDALLNDVDLIITVTGTIAIESILMNIPVVTLVDFLDKNTKNYSYLENINELPEVVKIIKTSNYYKNSEKEQIQFLNWFNKTSYKGYISDPFTDKNCIQKENINNIVDAFIDVIDSIK